MGRFYKTAKPEMVDFMYKIPEKALFAAVQTADQKYEDQVKYLSDLEKYLQASVMESDQARTNELLKEAESQIKNFTLNLMDSPSAAINKNAEIRAFGQKLHENYTRGELAHYMNQKRAEDQFVKEQTERTLKETGKVLPTDLEDFRRIFKNKYNLPKYDEKGNFLGYEGGGKWDETLKKGRQSYISEALANYVDGQEYVFKKSGDTWAADGKVSFNSGVSGDYIVDSKTGEKIADYNEVLTASKEIFMNNPELIDYWNQKIQYGLTPKEDVYGLRDENGQYVPLTTKNEKGEDIPVKDKYGNIIPKKGGIIHDIAVANAKRLGFKQTESGITGMKATPEYEMRLAIEKENILNPVAKYDVQTGIAGTAWGVDENGNPKELGYVEALNEIKKSETELATAGKTKLDQMLHHLNESNNSKYVPEFTRLWTKATNSGDPKDWNNVTEYAKLNGLLGITVKDATGKAYQFGTGINDYASQQQRIKAKKINQENLANNIARDAAYKILSAGKGKWMFSRGAADYYFNDLSPEEKEKEVNRFISFYNHNALRGPEIEKLLYEPGAGKGGADSGFYKEFAEIVNTKSKEASKQTFNYTFTNGGESFENAVGKDEANKLARQLKANSTAPNILTILSGVNTGALIVATDSNGKTVNEPGDLQTLLTKYNLTPSGIKTSSGDLGESYSVSSSSGEFKVDFGQWTVSPSDINNQLGSNSKRMVITLNELDANKKPTGNKRVIDIYIPGKTAIFDAETEKNVSQLGAMAAATDLMQLGDSHLDQAGEQTKKNPNNAFVQCQYGTGAKYNYVTKFWTLPGYSTPVSGDDGAKIYAQILKQQGLK